MSKTNVETMCTVMGKWCESPLYQRKDKKDCLLNLEVSQFNPHSTWCPLQSSLIDSMCIVTRVFYLNFEL